MKKLFVLLVMAGALNACKKDKPTTVSTPPTPVTDIDGNTYKTVKIGTQVWMAENLRTTHYQNGEAITLKKTDAEWTTAPLNAGYCDPIPAGIGTEYGKIYNGYAAIDPRNIAPKGWRVPTQADVDVLTAYLGDKGSNPLREKGTAHWASPNTGATNSTGFTAFPCPYRNDVNGNFSLNAYETLWLSTVQGNNVGFIYIDLTPISGIPAPKAYGCSVRCIKLTP